MSFPESPRPALRQPSMGAPKLPAALRAYPIEGGWVHSTGIELNHRSPRISGFVDGFFPVASYEARVGKAQDARRLQEVSNHKREWTTSDLSPIRAIQESFSGREPGSPVRKRRHSLEPDHERCACGTGRLEPEYSPSYGVGALLPAMSGNSPGIKRKRSQHPSTPDTPPLLSSDSYPTPTHVQEIEDSAEEDENEGRVLSAKRLKTRKIVKQHSSEVASAAPIEASQTAIPREDAQDSKHRFAIPEHALRQSFKSDWDRFQNRKSSAIPDYRPPNQSKTPAPAISKVQPAMNPLKGGVVPRNTLSGQSGINVSSNPRTQSKGSMKKVFDLTGYGDTHRESQPEHRARRQTIQHKSSRSNSNESGFIDLESEDNRRASNGKSAHSQNQSVRFSNDSTVGEYRQTEGMMSSKQSRPRKHKRFGSNGEILADPIELDPEQTSFSRPIQGRSRPEVRIPAKLTSQIEIPGEGQSRGLALHESETSPYFTRTPGPARGRGALKSAFGMSHHESRTGLSVKLVATESNTTQSQKYDGSSDEISRGHYGKKAQPYKRPLRGQADNQGPEESSIVKKLKAAEVEKTLQQSSSDDEQVSRKGDIPQTKFSSLRTRNHDHLSGQKKFDLTEVYTLGESWLRDGNSGNSWSLYIDIDKDIGKIDDASGRDIPGLKIAPSAIQKIQMNVNSPRIIIHQPRDERCSSHQILLGIRGRDQRDELLETLFHSNSSIKRLNHQAEHIDRIFEKNESSCSRPKRSSLQPQPDDLKLLERNQKQRLAMQHNPERSSQPRIVDRLQNNGAGYHSDIGNRTSMKRGRSDADHLEDNPDSTKKIKLYPEEFYTVSKQSHSDPAAYGTRSVARAIDSGGQTRQNVRTPSPERWTAVNPSWGDQWESSISYPRDSKVTATIDKQDIERLDEGGFLNDNLITFYLLWLQKRLENENPNFAKRVYIHNTFFYERLTKGAKGKRINYDAVARWTAKVDLFSFDYIIVPVNESQHWYVAIICNAPRLLDPEKQQNEESHQQQIIAKPEAQKVDTATSEKLTSLSLEPNSSPNPVVGEMGKMSLEDNLMEETTLPIKSRRTETSEADQGSWPEPEPQPSTQANMPIVSSPSRANAGKHEQADEGDPVISDLQGLQEQKQFSTKKGRRKSGPASRKYNPKDPRIITLDSLGLSHSPTCINLKEYLIAEAKAKKQMDIPPPGSIGMTAKDIPMQTNFCDCGLFLLSYIDMFFTKGDEFIHHLLQNSTDFEEEWRSAPDMRNSIRNLLFDLQQEQIAENLRLRKAKSKAKRTIKAEPKPDLERKADIREPPKSGRASPKASISKELPSQADEKPIDDLHSKPTANLAELWAEDEEGLEHSTIHAHNTLSEEQIEKSQVIPEVDSGAPDRGSLKDQRAESRGVGPVFGDTRNRNIRSTSNLGWRESETLGPGATIANAVEILVSPEKSGYRNHQKLGVGDQRAPPMSAPQNQSPKRQHSLVEIDGTGQLPRSPRPKPFRQETASGTGNLNATGSEELVPSTSPRTVTPNTFYQNSSSPKVGSSAGSADAVVEDDNLPQFPTARANEDEFASQKLVPEADTVLANGSSNLEEGDSDELEFLTERRTNSSTKFQAQTHPRHRQQPRSRPGSPDRVRLTSPLSSPQSRIKKNQIRLGSPARAKRRQLIIGGESIEVQGGRVPSADFRDASDRGIIGKYKHS